MYEDHSQGEQEYQNSSKFCFPVLKKRAIPALGGGCTQAKPVVTSFREVSLRSLPGGGLVERARVPSRVPMSKWLLSLTPSCLWVTWSTAQVHQCPRAVPQHQRGVCQGSISSSLSMATATRPRFRTC